MQAAGTRASDAQPPCLATRLSDSRRPAVHPSQAGGRTSEVKRRTADVRAASAKRRLTRHARLMFNHHTNRSLRASICQPFLFLGEVRGLPAYGFLKSGSNPCGLDPHHWIPPVEFARLAGFSLLGGHEIARRLPHAFQTDSLSARFPYFHACWSGSSGTGAAATHLSFLYRCSSLRRSLLAPRARGAEDVLI